MSTTTDVSRRRKLVTVLFCDVSGSTALGERADPEAVRDLMFRYFHEMRLALEHHGGTVEKFIGDAVVAVFGVPVAHEDDALRAVRAAAEMQERAAALNVDLEKRFGSRIALRIGINTGEVVAGDAAARETFVTGDAVNVAARLEQHADPGDVLLGQSTYELVRASVAVEPVAPISVKGKTEPLTVQRLLEVRLPKGRPARPAQTRLVGRDDELARLHSALDEVVHEGKSSLLTLLGDPGVGKSRLAAELVASIDEETTVLEGRCLSYGEGITYWALAEIVRAAAGIRDEHSAGEAQTRLIALLQDDEAASTHLGRLLGLVEGRSSPAEIALAARVLFRALASEHPVLVLIDDIQWAEAPLLDLIAGLPKTIDAPLFIVCLARPELVQRRADWGPLLEVEPLGEEASDALLSRALGDASLMDEVRGRIAAASRGNPLFIVEFVAMLVDAGILVRTNGSWQATRELQDFPVPRSITALLGERLDLLEEDVRLVLERGSVEGEVFHRGAVMALSRRAERVRIAPALKRLTEQSLVHPAQASFVDEAAFRFRHLLLREAAYRGVAKRVRAEWHERFAEWLEASAGERIPEYEEIVGYHLERSYQLREDLGVPDEHARSVADQASAHLGSAGRRALARGDLRAASNLLVRSLELSPAFPTDVAVDLIEARLGMGDFVGVERTVEELAQTGEPASIAYADVYRGFLELQRKPEGASARAAARIPRVLRLFETLGDERGLAKAWALDAMLHFQHGELTRTVESADQCRLHAARAGDLRREREGQKLIGASMVYGEASAAETFELLTSQLRHAKEHADLGMEAEVTVALAVHQATQGEFDLARDLAERGERLLTELGSHVHRAAFTGAAQVALIAGDHAEAERLAREAYDTLDRAGEKGYLSTLAASLGRIVFERGRLDEAWVLAERSRELGGSDDVTTQFGWRAVQARVLAERGELEEAERLAREAVKLIETTEYMSNRADGHFDLGVVLAAAGKDAEAVDAFTRSLRLWERKGDLVMTAETRQRLSELQSSGSPSQ
jgi:class 3 adenylate cyclase/tetratricopeptide (TPR) repeat protein